MKNNSLILKALFKTIVILGYILIILQLFSYLNPPSVPFTTISNEVLMREISRMEYFILRPYSMIINGNIGAGIGNILGANISGILGFLLLIIGRKFINK